MGRGSARQPSQVTVSQWFAGDETAKAWPLKDWLRAPVGHPPYPSGVHTVPQWGTPSPPVGYAPSPSGVHTVPQWGTPRPPVAYAPSPSGVRPVPQWGTHRLPVGYAPSPSGVRPVPQWVTPRPPVGHHACPMHEALDVLQRAERAPDSPVNTFMTGEMRRKYRRAARRLRRHETHPRYRNLHSAEELAGIYERTAQRDEMIEQGLRDLQRITLALGRVIEENDPEVGNAIGTFIDEAARSAEEDGPGSEAAQRYWRLQFLGSFGQQAHDHRRRPRLPGPMPPLSRDPSTMARLELTAAEILDSPPPGEAVIAIPPEGSDSGRERAYIRIGLGEASWIGSFEIGYTKIGSISMMPDNKHLFVSAKGAGYIIDATSHTLVEQVGTHVAFVRMDAPRTLFLVDHNGMSLELFGKSGRLWKTETISSGGFREISLEDTEYRRRSAAGVAGGVGPFFGETGDG